MTEALNGTFKAELIEMQGPWTGFEQVERAIFQWVTWYNEERLRSALDYVPPAEYERDFWRSQERTPQPCLNKITGLYETRGSPLSRLEDGAGRLASGSASDWWAHRTARDGDEGPRAPARPHKRL